MATRDSALSRQRAAESAYALDYSIGARAIGGGVVGALGGAAMARYALALTLDDLQTVRHEPSALAAAAALAVAAAVPFGALPGGLAAASAACLMGGVVLVANRGAMVGDTMAAANRIVLLALRRTLGMNVLRVGLAGLLALGVYFALRRAKRIRDTGKVDLTGTWSSIDPGQFSDDHGVVNATVAPAGEWGKFTVSGVGGVDMTVALSSSTSGVVVGSGVYDTVSLRGTGMRFFNSAGTGIPLHLRRV